MELGLVAKTSRNVCIELKDTGIFIQMSITTIYI